MAVKVTINGSVYELADGSSLDYDAHRLVISVPVSAKPIGRPSAKPRRGRPPKTARATTLDAKPSREELVKKILAALPPKSDVKGRALTKAVWGSYHQTKAQKRVLSALLQELEEEGKIWSWRPEGQQIHFKLVEHT